MSAARKEVISLMQKLQKLGWQVSRTNGGHWKIVSPDGQGPLFQASTPRSTDMSKTVKRLKQLGYKP